MTVGKHGQLGARIAAVFLAGGVFALGFASCAQANSYDVYACYAGQNTYLNPGFSAASWVASNNNGANYYYPYDQCGSGGPNGFGIISRSGYVAPADDYGQWSFTAPTGLHIREVQLWRALFDYGLGSGGASQRNYAWNLGDGQLPAVGDQFDGSADVPFGTAGAGDWTNKGIVPSNYIAVNLASALPTTYAYVIGCGFANGCTTGGHDPASPSGPDTIVRIFGAIVTVEDDIPPTLTLGTTGLLDGNVQAGMAPLTINASAIAGIEKVAIYAGSSSNPSFTQDFTQSSNCQFWETVPCQNLENYQYPVDTTKLPNGTYYITVKAYDPANNVVAVSSPSPITVQNAIAASGGSITGALPQAPVAPHIANGQTPCAGEALDLTINGRAKPPVVLYGRTVTVKGVLHCGTVPIRGARIDVATLGGPASTAIATSVQSALDGSFAYRLPTGPDRALRFSYTAYSDDADPSAVATAAIMVAPRIKLRIGPHRTSNGHAIRWSGMIASGPYPSQGVTLVAEVREGSHWHVFDQIVSDRRGRFAYSYRFHATTAATTYTFRVALPHTGAQGYPYAPGTSNSVRVRVNP